MSEDFEKDVKQAIVGFSLEVEAALAVHIAMIAAFFREQGSLNEARYLRGLHQLAMEKPETLAGRVALHLAPTRPADLGKDDHGPGN